MTKKCNANEEMIKKIRLYSVWMLKKILRLAPLFYLAIILSYFISCIGMENMPGSYWLGSLRNISVYNLLSHLFFVNGFFPCYINSMLGVEWYIADLVIFYLLTLILYQFIDTEKKAYIGFAISIGISGLVELGLSIICMPIPDEYVWTAFVNTFGFWTQLPIWMIGIILYFKLQNKEKSERVIKKCLWGSLLILLIALTHHLQVWIVGGYLYYKFRNETVKRWELFVTSIVAIGCFYLLHIRISSETFFAIGFSLLLFSHLNRPICIIENCVFRSIGKLSYAIYLFHFFIIYIYDTMGIGFGNQWLILTYVFKFLVVMSISFILALLLKYVIENPTKLIADYLVKNLIFRI